MNVVPTEGHASRALVPEREARLSGPGSCSRGGLPPCYVRLDLRGDGDRGTSATVYKGGCRHQLQVFSRIDPSSIPLCCPNHLCWSRAQACVIP